MSGFNINFPAHNMQVQGRDGLEVSMSATRGEGLFLGRVENGVRTFQRPRTLLSRIDYELNARRDTLEKFGMQILEGMPTQLGSEIDRLQGCAGLDDIDMVVAKERIAIVDCLDGVLGVLFEEKDVLLCFSCVFACADFSCAVALAMLAIKQFLVIY